MGALSVVMGALCSAGQEPEPYVDAKGKAAVQERARGDWVDYGVLGGIKLDEEEQKKVDKIKIDNLKYLNTPEHAEDKKVIEKIYADCGAKDVYGGALDIAHFKTKFPRQGQHLFDQSSDQCVFFGSSMWTTTGMCPRQNSLLSLTRCTRMTPPRPPNLSSSWTSRRSTSRNKRFFYPQAFGRGCPPMLVPNRDQPKSPCE